MATANLQEKASFGSMQRLGDLVKERIALEMMATAEKAGFEPTTGAEAFEDRNGYMPDFLPGWKIPLPMATGDTAGDMLELKRGGTGVELKYENFSVIMSKSRRMPMLTAANINGAEARPMPRINVWSYDGRIDEEDQWGDVLYDNNILDRGHMVRREDPVWGERADIANRDTFHFTNSCPQVTGVNGKTWLGLENYILHNARTDNMRVNVYTGPYFTGDDLIYREARVPLAFWKVVAIVTEDRRPSATAYRVSQEKELSELEFVFSAYKTFQVSIQSVIDATGIDFSALLEFDGFSEEERRTGRRMEVRLETLADVRI